MGDGLGRHLGDHICVALEHDHRTLLPEALGEFVRLPEGGELDLIDWRHLHVGVSTDLHFLGTTLGLDPETRWSLSVEMHAGTQLFVIAPRGGPETGHLHRSHLLKLGLSLSIERCAISRLILASSARQSALAVESSKLMK